MSKYRKKCECKGLSRPEFSLLLTKHHPQCPAFNPSNELKGMEDQCRHFIEMITKLQKENRDLKDRLEAYE